MSSDRGASNGADQASLQIASAMITSPPVCLREPNTPANLSHTRTPSFDRPRASGAGGERPNELELEKLTSTEIEQQRQQQQCQRTSATAAVPPQRSDSSSSSSAPVEALLSLISAASNGAQISGGFSRSASSTSFGGGSGHQRAELPHFEKYPLRGSLPDANPLERKQLYISSATKKRCDETTHLDPNEAIHVSRSAETPKERRTCPVPGHSSPTAVWPLLQSTAAMLRDVTELMHLIDSYDRKTPEDAVLLIAQLQTHVERRTQRIAHALREEYDKVNCDMKLAAFSRTPTSPCHKKQTAERGDSLRNFPRVPRRKCEKGDDDDRAASGAGGVNKVDATQRLSGTPVWEEGCNSFTSDDTYPTISDPTLSFVDDEDFPDDQ